MKLEKYNNNDEIYCQVVNCSHKIVDGYNLTLHIEGVWVSDACQTLHSGVGI